MTATQDAATAHVEMRRQDTNPLPRLEQVHNVDEVVRNLDQIIDWATEAQSTIGYFAVLYMAVNACDTRRDQQDS